MKRILGSVVFPASDTSIDRAIGERDTGERRDAGAGMVAMWASNFRGVDGWLHKLDYNRPADSPSSKYSCSKISIASLAAS